MYYRRRYVARIKLREELDFRCTHCDYKTTAMVEGSGRGEARMPWFFGKAEAAERASERAEQDGRDTLRETLRLACCPKCNQRNRSALFWARFKAGFVSAFFGLLMFPVIWALDEKAVTHLPTWIAGVLAVGVSFGAFWIGREKWHGVHKRVTFSTRPRPEPAAPRPPAPPLQRPPRGVETDPFRAPPSVPLAVINTARPPAPTPVVAGDPDHKPRLLT